MLPVSCWEQIAQAAGAVSASRLTCTASWLAAAQQYGTRERHEAEIELLRYDVLLNFDDDSDYTYTCESEPENEPPMVTG